MTIHPSLLSDPRKVVYVDNGPAPDMVRNGSRAAPFALIQDAIDYAIANLSPTDTAPIGIEVAPGIYDENVVVQVSGIFLHGYNKEATQIRATTGVPITFTNATLASLATYRTTGTYSDLVNMGSAGPLTGGVENFYLVGLDGSSGLECLGVKGDVAAQTTDFGTSPTTYLGFSFRGLSCVAWGGGAHGIYVRNAGTVDFVDAGSYQQPQVINCYNVTWNNVKQGNIELTYDNTDPDGYHADGMWASGWSATQSMFDRVTLNGTLVYKYYNSHLSGNLRLRDTVSASAEMATTDGNLDLNDASVVDWDGGYVRGNVTLEADCTATLRATDVIGDVTITNGGVGAMTMTGGRIMGAITDVGGKLTHTQGNLGV